MLGFILSDNTKVFGGTTNNKSETNVNIQ